MTTSTAMDLIQSVLRSGRKALSEHEAKQVLSAYGIPVTREALVHSEDEAAAIAGDLGYPVALKACSADLLHKSESGAVLLHLADPEAVRRGYGRLAGKASGPSDGVLVQEMIPGNRELVLGLTRDPQFGPCVMLGLGGVMTEVLQDTAFRVAPLDRIEAEDMTRELRSAALLGAFRGQAPADLNALTGSLVALGRLGMELEAVAEVDVNPLIITPEGRLVAADALVTLRPADSPPKDPSSP